MSSERSETLLWRSNSGGGAGGAGVAVKLLLISQFYWLLMLFYCLNHLLYLHQSFYTILSKIKRFMQKNFFFIFQQIILNYASMDCIWCIYLMFVPWLNFELIISIAVEDFDRRIDYVLSIMYPPYNWNKYNNWNKIYC